MIIVFRVSSRSDTNYFIFNPRCKKWCYKFDRYADTLHVASLLQRVHRFWCGFVLSLPKRQWLVIRQEAAVKVQAWFRGSRVRRWYQRLRGGVIAFQAAVRGFLLRKTLPELRRRLPPPTVSNVLFLCICLNDFLFNWCRVVDLGITSKASYVIYSVYLVLILRQISAAVFTENCSRESQPIIDFSR